MNSYLFDGRYIVQADGDDVAIVSLMLEDKTDYYVARDLIEQGYSRRDALNLVIIAKHNLKPLPESVTG